MSHPAHQLQRARQKTRQRPRPVPTRRRLLAAATVVALPLLGLTACGGGDSSGPGASTTPVSIEITIKGDSVTPNGERVKVGVGQPIELHVTADAAGEIHVHSDPEQELEYDAGTTTLDLDPVTQPGVVDVESHTLDVVIVQLEVS